MNKKRTLSIGFLLLLLISFVAIPFISIAATYTMGISTGKSVVWEDKYVNTTAIQGLITYENYPSSWLQNEVGNQLRVDITDIDEYEHQTYSTYKAWGFELEGYTGTDVMNGSTTSAGDDTWYTYKDPEHLADLWTTDDLIDFLVFLPIEVNAYLTAFEGELGSGYNHITVAGSTITQDNTQDGKTDKIIISFDANGIQNNRSYYYNGYLAYRDELVGYYDTPSADMIFIIVILIVVGITVAVVAGVIYSKSKRSSSTWGEVKDKSKQVSYRPYGSSEVAKPPIPTPISTAKDDFFSELDTSKPVVAPPPAKETPKLKIAGACELCGADQEEDAKFCPNCGNKFD